MPDKLLSFIPFIMSVNGEYKINMTRIIEAVIISVLGGAVAGYITMVKMEVKMADLKEDVRRLEAKVDKIYGDIYRPEIGARRMR